ncbi:pre-mRNA splicing Prp18-interacting factor [Artemisia annua]|uniref:Pre-mRNA-splicing factor SLU7 n=1 Tax=Artemisia annua TaxID=35608 RepID=A0A2U1NR35_ARTAN|nr:pre-mRNA splicing Prp18-interacting factor [Artemisia annua]
MESCIPCVGCGEPLFGSPCRWCTCERCGNDIPNGSCLFCGSSNSFIYDQNPNSFNNSSDFYDYPPQPNYSSYDQRYCDICGDSLDSTSTYCQRCTCERCGRNLINGFCSFCASENENSYSYDFNPNFSNYPQNDFYLLPQNSYEQEPCFNNDSFQNTSHFENCGESFENVHHESNPSQQQHGCEYCGGPHFSTDCQTRNPYPCGNKDCSYPDHTPQYRFTPSQPQIDITDIIDLDALMDFLQTLSDILIRKEKQNSKESGEDEPSIPIPSPVREMERETEVTKDPGFTFTLYKNLIQINNSFHHGEITRAFKSGKDRRKQKELEEARKAGLAPAEVDEDGKEINPHIPAFMSSSPWYLNAKRRSLKHQKNWKLVSSNTNSCYDRGVTVFQADTYRKGACKNCGAMTHKAKDCVERPRKVGAEWTSENIAPDEKIETIVLDYDGKRDRWNGYDTALYAQVIDTYEGRDEARKKYLKEQQLKKLEKGGIENADEGVSDDEDNEDGLKVDEAKVDESKQMDFAKVEKRVRTTGGGSTGTVRNLRIREDRAKYLFNLDVNSAYYDPKTRSMREDPLPDMDPNEKFYAGDNQNRVSGQAWEFKQTNMHALESYVRGSDVHVQAAPSQAEILYKNYKFNKERLKSLVKKMLVDKYGNAAAEETLPRELLLGQSEREVEYDRAGRVIRGQEMALPKSKYEEDVCISNHTTVWGSWWNDHQWGYKCCKQFVRISYCTGAAGIEAAEAAIDLMKSNIARKEAATEGLPFSSDVIGHTKEMQLATWGTDIPDNLDLDQDKVTEAIKKGTNRFDTKLLLEIVQLQKRKGEEKDERKRKYNVKWDDQVTAEDMEAYRMTKICHEDPMKDFIN